MRISLGRDVRAASFAVGSKEGDVYDVFFDWEDDSPHVAEGRPVVVRVTEDGAEAGFQRSFADLT